MIQLKNITKSFDLNKNKVEVLKGINLEIGDDEFIALMGPSGSGKSTLLGILAGIDSPTSGDIFIYGQDISKKKEDELARFRNKNVGIIFQAYNLIPSLNAIQNVKAPLYAGKNKLNNLPATYVEDENEAMTLELTLVDSLKNVKLILSYSVFEEFDAITRSVKIINDIKNNYMTNIKRSIVRNNYDIDTMDVVITGGTALSISGIIKEHIPHARILENSQWHNVLGFLKVGEYKYEKQIK